MGKPEPISVIRSVAEPVAAAVAATSPRPFAGDSAGSGYFESDHHHRYIATAIFRELAKGHGLVLLSGEHTADVDLVERFLNEEGRDRYRASLVRCRPEMDFGALVRAYNRRLGLRQEAGSDGIWALLSHLMAEVRKGVRRLLVLENAESLDLTCFDELLRFMRLDEPHVMPVVLLGSADFAERLATPAFGFLNSAITGRVPFDRIEQEEVGAFLHYQLNVLPGDERALFPPEIVNLIAVQAGGSAAVVNRLALDVLEQGRRDVALAAPPEPAPAIAVVPAAAEAAPEPAEEPEPFEEPELLEPLKAEPLKAEPLKTESSVEETLEAEAVEAEATEAKPAEAEAAQAEPLKAAEPPPRLMAGGRSAISAVTVTKEKRRARLSLRSGLALYVAAAVLAGLGLLYFLAPRGHEPSATMASNADSAKTPITAAPEASSAAVPAAKAAPSDAAAAQAAAVEPAAGPPATPPASAPETASDQNGPIVIGAKIVPLTASAPPASDAAAPAPAAAAAPEPTASANAEPSPSASSEPAAPPAPPVASAAPQPAPSPPAAPAPSRAADAAPASPASSDQPAAPAPSEAAAAAPEPASPAPPKAGTSTASQPVPAASEPASPAPAAQAAAPAASGATQAIAPLAALEPANEPSQEQQQAQPPRAAHPSAELTLLVQRGDELLAAGDIYSARQFYERAAQAGDPAAECGLGKSYDPVFLRQLGARGVAGDAATAVQWYRRAAAAGNNEAAARLARLDAADPNRSKSK
ncbi:MAG TPA: AAA family ATPase [Stellaceae bacterium]|nr:AAA family ATPase [Stellaceae bacterium]